MSAIAIIPARQGSKRLPGKNIRDFLGKPMIGYSIESALRSGLFERVIVSTDSDEIAEISVKFGAEVPFIRPPDISDDFTPITDVLKHALDWLKAEEDVEYEYACMILATAPLIQTSHLKSGFTRIKKNDVVSVIPVTSFAYPIFRSLKVDETDFVSMYWPEHELTRSNDLPEALHDIGQFYWVNTGKYEEKPRLISDETAAVRVARHFVQDLDTEEDWVHAELLYEAFERQSQKL